MEKQINRQGMCPVCGKMNLDYDTLEIDGVSAGYPWACKDCGTQGTEWYNLIYVEQIINYNAILNKNYDELLETK